ncbi:MAG: antibiotic biosynthesis monooxygenase [Trueperaceae bacterium]
MVVTILEARVAPDRVEELHRRFKVDTLPLAPGIHETYLLHDDATDDATDGSLVRIVTVWSSRQALEAMRDAARASGAKPKGVEVLEAVGALPQLSVLDVLVHHTK